MEKKTTDNLVDRSLKPLMVGPLSGIVTGQMVSFRESCNALGDACVTVDSAFPSFGRLASYPLRLLMGAICSRGPIYFTSSRSKVGFLLRDLPIFLVAMATRRPLVNHLHGNDFNLFRDSLGSGLQTLVDACYRRVGTSCAPTASLLRQYDRYEAMRCVSIPNFFSPEISKVPLAKVLNGPLHVVYLSNLMFTKGFTVAIAAIDQLKEWGVPVHLTLCGSPLSDNYMTSAQVEEELAFHRGKAHITVAGAVFGQEKCRILASAHVFVLPTTYPTEASPISILEAFGAGCYVITTSQGAIPELLQGFHADLQPADATAFAASLKLVFETGRSPEIWKKNRDLAVKNYSLDRYQSNIRELLKND